MNFVNDYTVAMTTHLDDAAIARAPIQARSRDRFEKVVKAADAMLAEHGLSGFSIPALAETLSFSRRSIYLFFPTPYAVLNEVTRRYVKGLENYLTQMLANLDDPPIEELIVQMTYAAADFHNHNPVARLLILGGAVTDKSFRAQDMNTLHLGRLARHILLQSEIVIPPSPPDMPTLAIELGTACFRLSHARHGEITDSYKVEAAHVMLLYLSDMLNLNNGLPRDRLQQLLQGTSNNLLLTPSVNITATAD